MNVAAEQKASKILYAQGVAFWNEGRKGEAVVKLDQALREEPDFAEALCMGAFILREEGKVDAAQRFYGRALELKPDFVVAWSNLGKLLFDLRRFDEALAAFDRAVDLAPTDADHWNNKAGALREVGRLRDSVAAAAEALRLRPRFAEAALNLGNALLKLDEMEAALQAYRRAQACRPGFAAAICGEALALRAIDRLDDALAAFETAERLGCVEATSGKGCLHLMLGDFARGWEGYEARWISGRSLKEALGARHPDWSGEMASGLSLLVMNDHGLGDTLQFCRYLPLLAQRGLNATFLCPSKLHRLLAPGVGVRLTSSLDDESFDAQIALSSLPRAFKTRLDSVPASVPYLRAESALTEKWAARIGSSGFKIGVVWQGNLNPEADISRSIPLTAFAPIARNSGTRLISLQKGYNEDRIRSLAPSVPVESLGDAFDAGADAFVDTAAAMMSLDLIITCDTSIAHLAGALARPVWVILKKDAEWRWLRGRADSPWYPTMRLFRQPRRGAWNETFEEMAEQLALLVANPPRRTSRTEPPCAA